MFEAELERPGTYRIVLSENSSKALSQQGGQLGDVRRNPPRLIAKLFDESVGHRQVRKTPAIIRLAFLRNYTAMSRLDMSRIMKVHDPTA